MNFNLKRGLGVNFIASNSI